MKRFLLLQFREGGSTDRDRDIFEGVLRRHVPGSELFSVNALDDHGLFSDPDARLPEFDGVIIGGSSKFFLGGNIVAGRDAVQEEMLRRLEPLLRAIVGHDIPTLGICYGHQLLGRFLGAGVVNDDKQSETGTFPLTLSTEGAADILFDGIGDDPSAHFAHRDSLSSLPDRAILLASGGRSRVAAFRYGSHVYGVQFHPELSHDDIVSRAGHDPVFQAAPGDGMSAFAPGNPAERVLGNFLKMAAGLV